MNLVNIHNDERSRDIYLFLRNPDGQLNIRKIVDFFPYYFDESPEGTCLGYDGARLKKLFVNSPRELTQRRTGSSYEADVYFAKRFIIDKVQEFWPTALRWNMIDMETLSKTLPKPLETQKAPDRISCITLYDNLSDRCHTWYLGDYAKEEDLWNDFCDYLRNNPPDLLIAHNMYGFDYPYLYYRIPGFAARISPIGQTRYGMRDIRFPAGISIIDSREWWKKYTLDKEESYALESLMEKYLGYDKGKYKNIDFSKLSTDIAGRCLGDVKGLVELEKKMQMIPHFDMIRRISHVEWEDFKWNSRIIDMFLLREAKSSNVALPMKLISNNEYAEREENKEFEGAFREAFETGAFYGVGKYDLSGAYCYAITDLCLDSVNIVDSPGEGVLPVEVRDRATQELTATYFVKQNKDALLPRVVKQLVEAKNELKKLKYKTRPDDPAYKEIKRKYEAFKTIVLSAWGVIGNRYFRLFDYRVASMITAVVRDLLHFMFEELKKAGRRVIYIDTDSVFIFDNGQDISEYLNGLVRQWAVSRFGKDVTIRFDYEGHFEKLLILKKCRYVGYLNTGSGIDKEIKGVEAKRKDSTKFMKKFQETLIDKILNKESRESIFDWIYSQKEDIRRTPLQDIAFPCSLSKKPFQYDSYTKTLQALDNTPGFHKDVGENFYFIYVKPEYYVEEKQTTEYYREAPGKREGTTKKERVRASEIKQLGGRLAGFLESGEIRKTERIQKVKKARDVMAFDEDHTEHLREPDWVQIIRRNIILKLETIFEAMGWADDLRQFDIEESKVHV